jgi:hypothetical protein
MEIRQLNDLGKPNFFPVQELLEKLMNFLEGKGNHNLLSNVGSLKSEGGAIWMGHWGDRHKLRQSWVH